MGRLVALRLVMAMVMQTTTTTVGTGPQGSGPNGGMPRKKPRMTSWQRRKARAAAGAPAKLGSAAEYMTLVRLCTEAKAASREARERFRLSKFRQSASGDDAKLISACAWHALKKPGPSCDLCLSSSLPPSRRVGLDSHLSRQSRQGSCAPMA